MRMGDLRSYWPLCPEFTRKYTDYTWFVLRIPHPAYIRDDWREVGAEGCHKSFASVCEGQ